MERGIFLHEIEARISAHPHGSVFVIADFSDIASAETANRALQRLKGEEIMPRVPRGVYERPEYREFLKENLAASPGKAAGAIARNRGWRIVPSGDTAPEHAGPLHTDARRLVLCEQRPIQKIPVQACDLAFKAGGAKRTCRHVGKDRPAYSGTQGAREGQGKG